MLSLHSNFFFSSHLIFIIFAPQLISMYFILRDELKHWCALDLCVSAIFCISRSTCMHLASHLATVFYLHCLFSSMYCVIWSWSIVLSTWCALDLCVSAIFCVSRSTCMHLAPYLAIVFYLHCLFFSMYWVIWSWSIVLSTWCALDLCVSAIFLWISQHLYASRTSSRNKKVEDFLPTINIIFFFYFKLTFPY